MIIDFFNFKLFQDLFEMRITFELKSWFRKQQTASSQGRDACMEHTVACDLIPRVPLLPRSNIGRDRRLS